MVEVEQEIYERVRVIHPAQVEDDRCMEIGQPKRQSLYNSREQDGECGDEDGCRLVLHGIQLDGGDFPIEEGVDGWAETQQVLSVGRRSNADSRYVWVSRDTAQGVGHVGVSRTCVGQHSLIRALDLEKRVNALVSYALSTRRWIQ